MEILGFSDLWSLNYGQLNEKVSHFASGYPTTHIEKTLREL